jgi:membrane protein implicated in regulation of membrane protease activity
MASRWLLIIALLATVVLFLLMPAAAYLAAIPIPVLFVVYLLAGQWERQSRSTALRQAGEDAITQEEVELDVRDTGIYTALGILFVLALGTFIIAAALFEWPLVGGVAAAGLLLAILINLPYLTLFVQEAEHDERDRVTGRSSTGQG